VGQLRFQTDALRRGAGRSGAYLEQLRLRAERHLGRLYDLLLRPLEALTQERRLVIVPHRALHYVPFHALFDGARALIDRCEVLQAPSAAVLQRCLGRPPRPLRRGLLLGVPDERAPKVRDEVLAIAPLLGEAQVLVGEEASLGALREGAARADVLHLACHGQFRYDNPLFSALRLGDGWLTARDAYDLQLGGALVVLSACETGVSAIAPGDELIGLARGFFAAGAPTMLVSLWTVDDSSTAELMLEFYGRMLGGARPAAALRAAQRAQRERTPHPFYWAPFVLLGCW
jgi:CHAT domain-containing protein